MSKSAQLKKEYNRVKKSDWMPPAGTIIQTSYDTYEVQKDGSWKKIANTLYPKGKR